MRHNGHAIQEYAIAFALIVALCMGSLSLLGGNISTLLNNSDVSRNAKTESLFSIIDAPVASSQKTGATGSNGNPQPLSTSVTLGIDPGSGQITLIESGNSGGKNTSSIDGSQIVTALANNLNLLTEFKTADGKPLPADVQGLLRQLASSGSQLGAFSQQYESQRDAITKLNQQIAQQQAQGQYQGEPYYDSAFVKQAIQYTEQYMAFSETYKQLSGQLAQNPAYHDLQTQLADYAGGISNLSHQNVGVPVFGEFHVSRINPQDLATAFATNPNTAAQFKALANATSQQSPTDKEKTFQSSIVSLGESLLVGSSVTAEQPLVLDPPLLTASR